MKQVKWGIIGLGGIASKFADGFQFTKNAKLLAISSCLLYTSPSTRD